MDQEIRIFKYFPPARTDVLSTGIICFSSPLNLNDPFELKPPVQLFESDGEMASRVFEKLELELLSNPPGLPPEMDGKLTHEEYIDLLKDGIRRNLPTFMSRLAPGIEEGYARFYSIAEERIGILCLTESPDDLLMWAHYAAAHTGFVVEFDPKHPFFDQRRSNVDELRHLRRVVYSSERPTLTLSTAKDLSALLTKSIHWGYENEWRMMVDLNDASEVKIIGSNRYHLFDFPRASIRSVILGCRMDDETKMEIHQALNGFDGTRPTILQCEVNKKMFRLDFGEIKS
ncbi:DUF2971 domain-containing protein [Pseudomonas sp. BN411]|uniref:DUF2971 domain-containing protein n=1 Tax=Pseudomonas sp. BN411 TaxID=2567887 RepID=UPI00245853B6|nr:DUF2971 domain-containing protein [Pseudomonas sp. BN411]MDH4560666.1 DUF2971 domain-containing protein [Pseudomonas sp. BN411]